jgi:phosphate transport system substrate-binding protein
MIDWQTLVTACALSGVALLLGGATALAQPQTNGSQAGRALADSSSPNVSGDFLDNLPRYSPTIQVSGLIRTFGNNYIPDLMHQWEEGFRKVQPGVQFETRLPGSEAAMAGLYGGVADLAFIGRESYPSEVSAFEQVKGYKPLGIEISSGSFQTPHKTFALMIFVNKSNPLTKASLEQLAGVYGCSGAAGGQPIREWGQLGLEGRWKHRRIHAYGYAPTTGMARYFQKTVLAPHQRWSGDLVDFDNGHSADGQVINAGVYVLKALANDPDGIAYANFLYAGPEVKAIALSSASGPQADFWQPTPENAVSRNYPLTRFTTVFVDKAPGLPLEPRLREFLLYILSRDGMGAVVRDGAYLPLNAKQIDIERSKIPKVKSAQ